MENTENHLDANTPKWFAVQTHFKREKMAERRLQNSNIESYLPLQKVVRHYNRKIKKVELPLINRYIFVKIKKEDYVKVLECPYVTGFVKFSKNLISIPENEISLIKRIIGEAGNVEISNNEFQKGDNVEVIGGNLTGLRGRLIHKENSNFLNVELKNIGISLNVSIAANLLMKVQKEIV